MLRHQHGEEHGFGLKREDGGREKSGGEEGAVFGKMGHEARITLDWRQAGSGLSVKPE
jgi:hypothetical protein